MPLILYKHQRNKDFAFAGLPTGDINMKVCITILLGLCVVAASGKCKPNENEICNNKDGSCFCRTCISCPEGHGPSRQCGGRYLNGTVIRCIPCIAGVSYSEENSIATCQPCPLCEGKETLQKCTPNRETSCGTKCKKGFIMNTAVDDCLPVPSFTTPAKPQNRTLVPNITIIFSFQPTNRSKIQVTSKPSHPNTSGRDGNPTSEDPDDHSKDNKIIILTVISLAVVLFVVYLLKKKKVACFHRRKERNQDGEEMARLTGCKETASARSSQEIVPWPKDLYLRDIKDDLRKEITTLISCKSTTVSGWHAIGEDRQFHGLITPINLEAIDQAGNKEDTNQGEHLLKQIKTVCPKFTLTQFVEILERLHRKDVIEVITTYFSNKNELNSAVQIEP